MSHAGVPAAVGELLRQRAAARPNDPFVLEAESGRVWTYAEFDRLTDGLAAGLEANGVQPSDRVGTLLPNGHEVVAFYLAALKIGALFNPMNPAFTPAEIAYIVANNRPRLVCTNRKLQDRLPSLDGPMVALTDGNASAWFGWDRRPSIEISQVDPEAPALLLYTSGSTGKPKGAVLTHQNLITNATEICRWLELGPRDRVLCVMPLFHANALVIGVTTPLTSGGSTVLCDRFSARGFWPAVHRFRPTTFGSVATMLSRLLASGPAPDHVDRSSVRFGLCGSAPVPVEVIERFQAVFGIPIIEGYGLTECTCRATFNPVRCPRPGSVGKPIGNELRIADDGGSECPTGTVGEVWIRGKNVMAGYFENPKATKAALSDGWLHSGDLGYLTEDGFLYLVGRMSDMIIRGGENIYPREIEDVLYRIPGVREAAVFGLPDADYGETVAACLTTLPGATVTKETVLAHCRSSLASFKCPSDVHFLEDLPKGPTGKLLKSALRRAFAAPAEHGQG